MSQPSRQSAESEAKNKYAQIVHRFPPHLLWQPLGNTTRASRIRIGRGLHVSLNRVLSGAAATRVDANHEQAETCARRFAPIGELGPRNTKTAQRGRPVSRQSRGISGLGGPDTPRKSKPTQAPTLARSPILRRAMATDQGPLVQPNNASSTDERLPNLRAIVAATTLQSRARESLLASLARRQASA